MKSKNSSSISRRKMLKLGTGTTAAAVAALYAPSVISSDPITLRYLGTAVSMGDEVQKKLFEDTGLKVKFIAVTTDEVTKRVLTQPNSFDLVDTEYFLISNPDVEGINLDSIIAFIDAAKKLERYKNQMKIYKKIQKTK